MKRKIIRIDEQKCNGCAQCIPNCPEGALQVIDGKARLISDLFCDGLGACIGTCPLNAISIEEREAEPYDERKVMENVIRQGPKVIKAHLAHLQEHQEFNYLNQAKEFLKEKGLPIPRLDSQNHPEQDSDSQHSFRGCPGMETIDLGTRKESSDTKHLTIFSELQQWPVQLRLINPNAPYFKNADLLIVADCVPFAFGDFHRQFLKGKIVITFCPKLDTTIDLYKEKLATILINHNIRSVTVVHMEVPCCSGTMAILQQALEKVNINIPIQETTVSITGKILSCKEQQPHLAGAKVG